MKATENLIMRSLLALVLLATFFITLTAAASPRCECEYDGRVVGCEARVELNGKWFKVFSDTQQCSRVDWYIAGPYRKSRVTLVTDGVVMEEWLGSEDSPEVIIQSCIVCKKLLPTGTIIFEQPEKWSGGEVDTEILINGKSVVQDLRNGQMHKVEVNPGNFDLQCLMGFSGRAPAWNGASKVQVESGDTIKFLMRRPRGGGRCDFIRQ
jgi:hypothetical protein